MKVNVMRFISFVKVIGIILLVSALIWASYLWGMAIICNPINARNVT
jgi:hypothetical protein